MELCQQYVLTGNEVYIMLVGNTGTNIRELEMLRHMNYISLIQWRKRKQSESLYQVLVTTQNVPQEGSMHLALRKKWQGPAHMPSFSLLLFRSKKVMNANKPRQWVKEQLQEAWTAMLLQANNVESSYMKHRVTIREGYIKYCEIWFTMQLLRNVFTRRKGVAFLLLVSQIFCGTLKCILRQWIWEHTFR